MTCGSCGTSNSVGSRFCEECGSPLAIGCTSCGAPLKPAAKFCTQCGTPTTDAASVPAARTPAAAPTSTTQPVGGAAVAERRLVSVLFADLVGFTPFSEERDSEEVRETLTRYFDVASEIVERHGGTVEKFIGDAVMAVWGTPVAREDDAERAVRSALQLVDAVRGLGSGISARAAVLTGEAAVTLGATNQGMVAGDIVNTAARLQGAAAPGTVLVGEATFRAASAAIAFEEAGEQVLKGKSAAVPTWRALRVVAERGGRNRSDGLEPPFVGRDEELRVLKDGLHATSREGRARLISVTGPAGMGKSRLAWEFLKYLDGVVEDVWWHHGRSPAHGQGMTFWALGEMVRARCGLVETADEATTREKVDAMLATHVSDASERGWVRPAILALLGVEGERVAAEELFARWRLLFERLAATGTVVLVFEDLHWADPATLEFIDHLLDWSRTSPIMVVTLARPELVERRADWGVGRRNFVALALDPLPEPAMRDLLAGLAPALPEDAVRRIVARAEGIPLYAVETIRMLVAEKRLVQEGDIYVPNGDVSNLAVPETLTALIAARLDALDPADRVLVLDAAVLGQSFTREALSSVSGVPLDELEPRLRGLVRRELFALEVDPRSPERGQYAFVQALIREVAYNTLAKRDRKDRHLAAARYFESVGSDELAGALAGHYRSAYEHAPEGPEAEVLAAQARVALRGAAERAFALASFDQAIDLLRQALTVTADPVDRATTLERIGAAAQMAGRHGEAMAHLEEALAVARPAAPGAVVARIVLELGRAHIEAGHVEAAATILSDPDVYRDADRLTAVGMRSQVARALMMAGDVGRAVPVADQVLAEADPDEMWALLADTLVTKGSCIHALGRVHEGASLLEAALQMAEEHSLLHQRFRALFNLGAAYGKIDPSRAIARLHEGLELARRLGMTYWANAFIGNLGVFAVRAGEWDLARAELGHALEGGFEDQDYVGALIPLIDMRSADGEDVTHLLDELARVCARDDSSSFLRSLEREAVGDAAFNAGRYAEACTAWRETADLRADMLVEALPLALRAALWAGDLAQADAIAAEMDALPRQPVGYRLPIEAARLTYGLVRGDADAGDRILDLIAGMRRVHVEYPAARAALDLGRFGDVTDPRVVAALEDVVAFADRVRASVIRGHAVEILIRARAADAAQPVPNGGAA